MWKEEYSKRIEWFKEARFGMFIHFGVYSLIARGEWVRSVEQMSIKDYEPYVKAFNPDLFDAKYMAKKAKEAGMRYAVLTAKHHDGYCLYDTKTTDYKAKKDYVREFLDAFREEGIKVGLYYSVIDWYHPDFPHYGDRQHPHRFDEKYKDYPHQFDRYLTYMHEQVRELCTNYGKIDIMWFDFSYDDMTGEKWEATKLVNMVRKLQPDIILDNRLEVSGEGFGSLMTDNPLPYAGDFVSPEQIIPPNGIVREDGSSVMWEACITMNENWGYHNSDFMYKEPSTIIRKLVECVSKNGNMILNVGPNGRGEIPKESIHILESIGNWMKYNKESIYGCKGMDIPKPENGRITCKGNKIYYHITEMGIGGIPLYGIKKENIKSIKLLEDGSIIEVMDYWTVNNYPDVTFIQFKNRVKLPNEIDTVIEIEVK